MNLIANAKYTRRQVVGGLVALFGATVLTLPIIRSRNSNMTRIRKTPLHTGDSIFAPRNDSNLSRWLTGR
ncbi:MAG: hypothetical protein CL785_05690 [Chloroflexi bacterium]|mgnify:FL=1|nr:hypothetical protein [Chloroflexota bacterium]